MTLNSIRHAPRASRRRSLLATLRVAFVAFAAFVALLGAGLAPREAFAEDRRVESAAKDAMRKAQADFADSAFDDAILRLKRAIKACTPARCTATTRAALQRDLGVMQLKKGKRDTALIAFGEAAKLDPKITLTGPYATPDVRAAWDSLRDEASGVQPSGDFVHTPAAEQAVRTPIPVYVEYEGSAPLTSVVVKYKGAGATEFTKIDLARRGKGWGGLIPCADVTEGTMRYYVQGFDSSGSPIALSGSPKKPHFVPVRAAISGRAPSLPGASPPATCSDTSDCPPGMAGCGAASSESSGGERCENDAQCATGSCVRGVCSGGTPGKPLAADDYERVWIGVSGSLDFVSLPAADDVCKLTSQGLPGNSAGYYCTNPDGTDFPSRASAAENGTLTQGKSGHVDSRFARGDVRVLLTFDYALTPSLLVGARLGYVAGGYPGSAASRDGRGFTTPVHVELRGTYLFGETPLMHNGFAPLVMAGLGAAPTDGNSPSAVGETGVPGQKQVLAWRTSGPLFAFVGVGTRYAFSPRIAFSMALKVAGAFGGGGFLPSVAPEVALQYGF